MDLCLRGLFPLINWLMWGREPRAALERPPGGTQLECYHQSHHRSELLIDVHTQQECRESGSTAIRRLA